MKYTFNILICTVVLVLFSCGQTNEDKIFTAFKDYAEKNLDNPSAISEIVGIDTVDTFSTIKIKANITKVYQLYDSARIMAENASNAFLEFSKDPNKTSKINKVELNRDPQFKSIMFNFLSSQEKKWRFAEESAKSAKRGDSLNVFLIKKEFDGIMNKKDTVFCGMKLSYRTKNGDDVKLHKIDVICDTLYSSFHFASGIPKEYNSLVEDFHYFTDKYKRDYDIDLEIRNSLISLDKILREKYNVGLDFEE